MWDTHAYTHYSICSYTPDGHMQEKKKKVVVWRKKLNTHTYTVKSTEGGESSSWSEVNLRASSEPDRRSCTASLFDVDEGCQEALAGCD